MSTSFIKDSDKAKKSFLAKQSLTIPHIPFIQGNGIGVDIISVMHKADAAGKKRLASMAPMSCYLRKQSLLAKNMLSPSKGN